MEKLDLKDRKILYQLFLDGRQSFRSIGRKVGLSKDIVVSRIQRLQENNVLLTYSILFDYFKLGLTPMRFYFKYQYITLDIKNEIINHFVNCKYSTNVYSLKGPYDLGVLMLVKNNTDIYPFWKKTLDNYGDYFEKNIFSMYMGETIYKPSFILGTIDKDYTGPMAKRSWEKVQYDDLDINILKLLSLNARMPTLEIAKKLNTTALTINNRIKKLIKKRVILGFTAWPNVKKLGFQFMKVDLYLKEHTRINQLINYVEKSPYLIAINDTLGYADIEFEFVIHDINKLDQIVYDIYSNFPKIIKNHEVTSLEKTHKFLIMPD